MQFTTLATLAYTLLAVSASPVANWGKQETTSCTTSTTIKTPTTTAENYPVTVTTTATSNGPTVTVTVSTTTTASTTPSSVATTGPTCGAGQTAQCCNSFQQGGLLGLVDALIGIGCVDILGGSCDQQTACCSSTNNGIQVINVCQIL